MRILYNNEIYAIENLDLQKTIEVDSLAVIESKNRRARIVYSTCKNKHCVNQGWTQKQPIICVPNKIMVELVGDSKIKRKKMFITH